MAAVHPPEVVLGLDVVAEVEGSGGQPIGALPLDLRPRADDILTRQLEAARAAALAITANRRQTAFASRVEVGTSGKGVPSYIDCAM